MSAPGSAEVFAHPAAAGAAPAIEVQRRSYGALTVAVRTHLGAASDVPRALQHWQAQIAATGLATGEAPLAIFSGGDRDLDTVPVRLCVPIAGELPAALGLRSTRLDAVEVIEAVYSGPYSGIGAAYDALSQWLECCELCVAQGVSETLLRGPSGDEPEGPVTVSVAMRLCCSGEPLA